MANVKTTDSLNKSLRAVLNIKTHEEAAPILEELAKKTVPALIKKKDQQSFLLVCDVLIEKIADEEDYDMRDDFAVALIEIAHQMINKNYPFKDNEHYFGKISSTLLKASQKNSPDNFELYDLFNGVFEGHHLVEDKENYDKNWEMICPIVFDSLDADYEDQEESERILDAFRNNIENCNFQGKFELKLERDMRKVVVEKLQQYQETVTVVTMQTSKEQLKDIRHRTKIISDLVSLLYE